MFRIGLAAVLAVGLAASPVRAFDANPFTIQVGFGPGAGFDLMARVAANHIGKYLPGNPSVIVENVEGAGSLRLLNIYLSAGATDGAQVIMVSPGVALDPIFHPTGATFDPRDFHYLVSFSNFPTYCLTTVASGITTFDQLITNPDVTIGTVGRGISYLYAASINRAFGAHFNLVSGFAGVAEVNLALARGELDAYCGLSYGSIEATRDVFDLNVVAELSPVAFNLIEGADFVLDRVTDPLTRSALSLVFASSLVWFPILAHPDTPPETVTILRDAFAALATDEAFLAEAATRSTAIRITPGAEAQALVEGFMNADEAVKAAARALVE